MTKCDYCSFEKHEDYFYSDHEEHMDELVFYPHVCRQCVEKMVANYVSNHLPMTECKKCKGTGLIKVQIISQTLDNVYFDQIKCDTCEIKL